MQSSFERCWHKKEKEEDGLSRVLRVESESRMLIKNEKPSVMVHKCLSLSPSDVVLWASLLTTAPRLAGRCPATTKNQKDGRKKKSLSSPLLFLIFVAIPLSIATAHAI